MTDTHPKSPSEIASQLWCLPQHQSKVMDVEFANSISLELEKEQKLSDAWFEEARREAVDKEYYRNLLQEIGLALSETAFGRTVFIDNSGIEHQGMFYSKIPELVRTLIKTQK